MDRSRIAGRLLERTVHIARRLASCEMGATAIEYGLIASLLGMAIISSASMTGNTLSTTFDKLSTLVMEASEEPPPTASSMPSEGG